MEIESGMWRVEVDIEGGMWRVEMEIEGGMWRVEVDIEGGMWRVEVDIEGGMWGVEVDCQASPASLCNGMPDLGGRSRWILRAVCGGLVDIMWRDKVDIEGGM